MIDPYNILITLSVLVVLSYIFNIISERFRIPSVILLLATGAGLNSLANEFSFHIPDYGIVLDLLGITGLIFIVTEGALELKLSRTKLPLIGKSILSALLILLVTVGIITLILVETLGLPLRNAIVYAVPLSVISSSVAIPSVSRLVQQKKEFIVYESTFSDIIGIMLFNYVVLDNILSRDSILAFFINFLIIIVVSVISAVLLLLILNYSRSHIKFYLIFAILILIYSLSKLFHLPSLLLVLVFGLLLNNAQLLIRGKLAEKLQLQRLDPLTKELKLITAESAFIIRTFFFLLFGFSIRVDLLQDSHVILTGSLIVCTIIIIRFIFLRFISHSNLFPGLFVAPRGLITIVLFYSIPVRLHSPLFNEGILLFVIIVSSLLMMLGLIATRSEYKEDITDLST